MPTHHHGTPEECRALDLLIKLSRAAAAVSSHLAASYQEEGLTDSQFGVLESLFHLGPMMPSQLAAKHLRSRNNLTTVIANLERQGLVRREPDPCDRRAVRVHLTDEGRCLIARIFPRHARAVVEAMKALSPEEQDHLSDLLRRLGRSCTCSGVPDPGTEESCPQLERDVNQPPARTEPS